MKKKRGKDKQKHTKPSTQRIRKPAKRAFEGKDWEWSYVSRTRYRKHYRFLLPWQRAWANYERRHPTYDDGLPAFGKSVKTICETDLGVPLAVIASVGPAGVCGRLERWKVRLSLLSGRAFLKGVNSLASKPAKS